jgi:hypothetical protein
MAGQAEDIGGGQPGRDFRRAAPSQEANATGETGVLRAGFQFGLERCFADAEQMQAGMGNAQAYYGIKQFPQTFGGSDLTDKNDHFRFRVQAQRGARSGTVGKTKYRCVAAISGGPGHLRAREDIGT